MDWFKLVRFVGSRGETAGKGTYKEMRALAMKQGYVPGSFLIRAATPGGE